MLLLALTKPSFLNNFRHSHNESGFIELQHASHKEAPESYPTSMRKLRLEPTYFSSEALFNRSANLEEKF